MCLKYKAAATEQNIKQDRANSAELRQGWQIRSGSAVRII